MKQWSGLGWSGTITIKNPDRVKVPRMFLDGVEKTYEEMAEIARKSNKEREFYLDSDRCEMCAAEMKVSHCKKQCPKCGFMVSCVD